MFDIEILTTEDQFKQLKKDWQNLIEVAQPDSIFLTFDWHWVWWHTYHKQFTNAQLSIITIRTKKEQQLLAILPLFSQLKRFSSLTKLRTLQLMGTEIESSDYLDIICPAEKKAYYLKTIFTDPKTVDFLRSFDVLILENVHDYSSLLKQKEALAHFLNSKLFSYQIKICPYLPLPEKSEQIFSLVSKNFRSNLKRVRNKIRKAGFNIVTIEKETEIDEAIKHLFRLHDRRFQDKRENTKFIFSKRGKFHQQIAKIFLKNGWLQLYQILDGKKVIGSLYCYKFKDTMMYMQGGFDPEYSQYALGNQIILRAIEDAITLKLKKFDFMRGAEAYKWKWTSEKIYLYQLIFPFTLKAQTFFFYQDLIKRVKAPIKKLIRR